MTHHALRARLAVAALTAVLGIGAAATTGAGQGGPVRVSAHFQLETVGAWRSERLEREALAALERWYRRYMIAFEMEPPLPIRVRLYPGHSFHASTGAPPWADGSYGRGEGIRVASGGVARLQEGMERVLAHELAHAFITERSRGRAPRWLQEGLAQALAPRGTRPRPAEDAGATPGAPDGNAGEMDYAAWHAFTASLIQAHGLSALLDVLADLGTGQDLESSLRTRLGAGAAGLYRSWQRSQADAGRAGEAP